MKSRDKKRPANTPTYCPDYYTCDRHVVSECKACMRLIRPKPKQDVLLERPEETPGYGSIQPGPNSCEDNELW